MKVRRKDEMLVEIMKGHQKYVDWWLPIDVAGGSFLAPMSCHMFCEYLLLHDDENWWYRWMCPEFLEEEHKVYDKRTVLGLIQQHYFKWIDLNNMTSSLEEHEKWVQEQKNKKELH